MNVDFRDQFIEQWQKYFGNVELPIVFFYSNNLHECEAVVKPEKWTCFVAQLAKVRAGRSLSFDSDAVSCTGGRRYIGFSDKLRPNFNYFLSCGNDEIEGEKYLQSPELVDNFLKIAPWKVAPASRINFKRWDMLTEADNPEVVIFYASPDVLSGLFTLSGYDREDMMGSITPFGSGCSTIIQYPLAEVDNQKPRAVIGMFDVSARPYISSDKVTFAIPFARFCDLVSYFDESFLTTAAWQKVRTRINKDNVK